jgi:PAS domain S-box-containing protein
MLKSEERARRQLVEEIRVLRSKLARVEPFVGKGEQRVAEGKAGAGQRAKADSARIIHELEVHHVELEMQNEELRRAQGELEASWSKYTELFEFAPVGYFVLDAKGVIVEANLAATGMLGIQRELLVGRPLSAYLSREDSDSLYISQRRVFENGSRERLEVGFTRNDGAQCFAELIIEPGNAIEGGSQCCRAAVVDITKRKNAEAALRASEARYRSYIDVTSDIAWVTDADGKVVEDIPAWREFTGQTYEEVKGSGWMKAVHPDDVERTVAAWQQAVATKGDYAIEYRIRRDDGVYRCLLARGVPVMDEKGDVREWVGTCTDITERKRSEEALRESEDKFKTLAEESLDTIVIHDGKKVIEVNKAFGKIWGWEPQEAIGADISEFMTDESLKTIEERIKSGYDRPYEVVGIRRDGIRFPLEITGKPIRYKGRPARIGTARDVTERKETEEALLESEERLQAALHAAGLGVWDWDVVNGRVTWAGHEAELFGLAESEFDGRYESFEKRVHPEDLSGLRAAVKKSQDEKTEYVYEYRIVRPDGSVHWLQGTGRWQYDDKGRPVRLLGVARDITVRKQAERALQESEIRFRELFEAMSSGVAVYEAINDGEDFIFTNVNRAVERIEKVRRAELIGKRVTEAFPGVKEFGLFEVFQRVWRTGQPERHPISLYKDKRLTHWVENYVYKLPSGKIVAVYDDVTERKIAEKKLRDYHEKLKALRLSSLLAEERERQNVARGLHDDIGQKLALAKLNLKSALQNGNGNISPEAAEKLCQDIDAMIERVRSLTFELSNPVLTELGLEAALERHLAREVRGKCGIEYELCKCGQLRQLDEDLAMCLFRSVRELLNNVIKHSGAKKVNLDVRRCEGQIVITVEDDGAGFEQPQVSLQIGDGGTFGLFSVKEQIESFGGRLKIESQVGRGSKFTIVVPTKAKVRESE